MSDYRPFHTFAIGEEESAGQRVEIACDASLDEGAIIRATFPPSPISSGVEYFVNVTPYQAACLADLLPRFNREDEPEIYAELISLLRRIEDHRIYTEQGTNPDAPAILEGLEAYEPAALFTDSPDALEVTVTSSAAMLGGYSVSLRGKRRDIVEYVRLHWGDDFSGNEAFPTWLEEIRDDNGSEV